MPRMTQAEVDAHQARLSGEVKAWKHAYGIPAEPVSRESELHEAIREECRRRGWIAFHGSMAHSTFRTKGENDFHCLLPGGKVLFVECKARLGKLSPEQAGLARWMKKLGHEMHIVRSLPDFICLISKETGSESL